MRGPWRVNIEAYDRLLSLPGPGWAWEFQRRDPALKAARRRTGAVRPAVVKREDGSTICRLNQRCHVAEGFGLHFIPDPALCAFEAALFWLPDVIRASFDAVAEPCAAAPKRGPYLSWTELPGEKFFLISPGRRDKLVIRAPYYVAQLALDADGAPIPQSACFSLMLRANHLAAENLRHLEEFGRICGGLPARQKPPRGAAPDRLRDALIALDGELAGVPRRRIAEAIFGSEQVCGGWDDGDESYKKRAKRLVEKGLELMHGGFRRLL